MTQTPLISIRDLKKTFFVKLGAFGETEATVNAVDALTFDILQGETLSLVGESGCGKSTAGFAILNLHRPTQGEVIYDDTDIAKLTQSEMRPFRSRLQVVFQDPFASLNPRMTVGEVIAEPLRFHRICKKSEISAQVAELLRDTGLPEYFTNRFPHELSGGQRQRVVIARALACRPEFIVCDEAISALDVSIQAQIINLLIDLQQKHNLTYLFIAHDLAVVRHMSSRVAVMYLGRLAELAPTDALYDEPLHPYTRALMKSVPSPDPEKERARSGAALTGDVPSPLDPPKGCYFHTRCPMAQPRCQIEKPEWREHSPGHWVACHYAGEQLDRAIE